MSNARTTARQLFHVAALGRPLHLLGGLLFSTLGVAMAAFRGYPINWSLALRGLLVIWAMQLMTHYSNEYFDLEADRANTTPTNWSGGSRVLVRGQVAPRVALQIALGMGLIAILAGSLLTLSSPAPWQTGLLLVVALGMAWSYSGPPLRLNWHAQGELTGALLVPGMTTLVGFQLQAGSITRLPLLAIVPLCCFQCAMLIAVNFPDAEGDRVAGKTTLVVRYGGQRAAWLYLATLFLAYALLPLLVVAGLPWRVGALLFLGTPIAAWLGWRVWRGGWHDPAAWDGLGFWSIGLLMGSALVELVGFVGWN